MIDSALADQRATDHAANMPKFKLHVFAGVAPATRAALDGSLLAFTRLITYQRTTVDGDGSYGIPWATPTDNVLTHDTTVSISGTAAATGYGTFVVITDDTDTLGSGAGKMRQLKTIGTSGSGVDFVQVGNTYYEAAKVYPWSSVITLTF